jgi:membrane protease YdiL (CAAX protease family)
MPVSRANPYRQLLKRRFPWIVPGLMALVLGFWLSSLHFGERHGYPPGTEEMALVKIDRDLRLADAMANDPAWLRWLARARDSEAVRAEGADTLLRLWQIQREAAQRGETDRMRMPLSVRGIEALEVLRAQESGQALLERLRRSGLGLPTPESTLRTRLATGSGQWWDAQLLRAYGEVGGPEAGQGALDVFERETQTLRGHALMARGGVWAVVLVGTLCLPWALSHLAGATVTRARGYSSAWSASLGWTVFLASTLAWIGFGTVIGIGLVDVVDLPPSGTLVLEAVVRMLPALIAVGFLFRRPRHALRVLGLDRSPDWPLVFGALAALLWFDGALSRTFEHWVRSDPTGGLSSMDAGLTGLVFVVVSTCLIAPLSEEIVYRGVLFRSLANRFGTMPGAVLAAGVFATIHFYNLYGLASVALLGLICALSFSASRRLSTAVALHVLYNAAVKLPEWVVYHASLN